MAARPGKKHALDDVPPALDGSDGDLESERVSPKKSRKNQSSKKLQKKDKGLPESKFGGMTEEEVCKLLLPDHMKPELDIIFVSE